jgi:hypothetical protein
VKFVREPSGDGRAEPRNTNMLMSAKIEIVFVA